MVTFHEGNVRITFCSGEFDPETKEAFARYARADEAMLRRIRERAEAEQARAKTGFFEWLFACLSGKKLT